MNPSHTDKADAAAAGHGLDAIDHVVVLMLENRSFDNVLGYLYPDGVPGGAPLGRTFDGLLHPDGSAKALANPVPRSALHRPPPGLAEIPVAPVGPDNFNCPYPDPGEEYPDINVQLFNPPEGAEAPPHNLPPGHPRPNMLGFVKDYIRNYKAVESTNSSPDHIGTDPTYDIYRQIMQCYTPRHLPVLSTLAQEFAVFDHWFCAVPSQTFCNRAFWHAGTSWGRVINEPLDEWKQGSDAPTLFNQISASAPASGLSWKIYSDNSAFYWLTPVIHAKAFAQFQAPGEHFGSLETFIADCAAGTLPSYSFLEPRFVNPHNDMHPSSTTGQIDGNDPPSSMQMGELLVWRIYEAVRTASAATGSNAGNTLLIITFDEHGGCYDHVPPPTAVPPALGPHEPQDGFDFKRLGVRVPMIMVSAQIARNTVVNTPMDHCSFMATLRRKWDSAAPGQFPPLTARVAAAPDFSEVFTARKARAAASWPVIPKPPISEPVAAADPAPISHLQKVCAAAVEQLKAERHPCFTDPR